MAEWIKRNNSAGSDLRVSAALRISTTDQTYRGRGWVWHVCVDHTYGNDALAQSGDCATEEEAQAEGIKWVRRFCEEALISLKEIA